jgi:hypothetical protein
MQFYETYKDNEIVSPVVRQISWTNNMIIFSHKSSIGVLIDKNILENKVIEIRKILDNTDF